VEKKIKKICGNAKKKSLNKLQFLSDDGIWYGWMIKWNGMPLNFGLFYVQFYADLEL
jgi:hypothetical protein